MVPTIELFLKEAREILPEWLESGSDRHIYILIYLEKETSKKKLQD